MFYVPLPYKCTKLNNKCTTKAIFTHIWHLWSVTFGPWERQNSIKCPELLNSTHWVIKMYIGKKKKPQMRYERSWAGGFYTTEVPAQIAHTE